MSQPLPILEQLKNLEHLQEIDLRIDGLKKGQQSLPEGLKAIDSQLSVLKSQIGLKNAQLNEIEKTHRQTAAANELNQDRLTRASQKLEVVHNSQEFQAANKEIEQLKKLAASLDEQAKKSTSDMETLKKDVSTMSEKLKQLQAERDNQAGVVSGRETQLNADISALTAERAQYVSQVENRILAQYDRVRGARAGIGIVPTLSGRCKGCNMMLPPQLFNEVQRGSVMHTCPSCHRILFAPKAQSAESAK